MLRHVLVPLDGSPLAETALDFTEHLLDTGCKITLFMAVEPPEVELHTMTPKMIMNPDFDSLDATVREARSYLENIAQKLHEHAFHSAIHVETGKPAPAIVRAATALKVDMIIMTTHGRSGISRWIYGSIARRVLSTAAQPVLIVPNMSHQEQFENDYAELNLS